MVTEITVLDYIVVALYLAVSVGIGCWFVIRSRSPEGFTAAKGNLSGVLVGLSIFGTYVSSISFLALPGKAFSSNWNSFVFSLSIPIAAWIATRWFVPFYRNINSISAYHQLEQRFGVWARVYATLFYMFTQVARMGSVMFLLALPLHALLGWDIPSIILLIGILTVFYSMLGGIEGVIWTDAIQSVVLIVGAMLCVITIPFSMPEGPSQLFKIAFDNDKFSLGSFSPFDLKSSTFWVVLVYGFIINLQNFGIDQSYVQRYLTAKSEKEAKKSVWLGAWLYLPVSLFFFFIGTSLYSFYTARPELLSPVIQEQIALGKGDLVFPYFIVHQLPTGITGLLIAAILAAGMSTLSSSINGAATLSLTDFYKRFWRPDATKWEQMIVLYASSLFWGSLGIACALSMMRVKGILDAWWALAGFSSGGMLGLFLLGFLSKRPRNGAAVAGVIAGLSIIIWMTLSHPFFASESLSRIPKSPFCDLLATVFGSTAIVLVGFLVTLLFPGKEVKS